MDNKKRTGRGFRIFDDSIPVRHGTLRVQESSLAFEGAHAWLFYDEDDPKYENAPSMQINVASAKQLIMALQVFIYEAEAGELTEPANESEVDDLG